MLQILDRVDIHKHCKDFQFPSSSQNISAKFNWYILFVPQFWFFLKVLVEFNLVEATRMPYSCSF